MGRILRPANRGECVIAVRPVAPGRFEIDGRLLVRALHGALYFRASPDLRRMSVDRRRLVVRPFTTTDLSGS